MAIHYKRAGQIVQQVWLDPHEVWGIRDVRRKPFCALLWANQMDVVAWDEMPKDIGGIGSTAG
jgi:hypothetical protein